MSWDYDKSHARITKHAAELPTITIKKLEREADLESLLTETECREIVGAHVYLDIPNFSRLTDGNDKGDALRKLLRAMHIYQRQLAWIVESLLGGVRVHFQGARLHALIYRPVDNTEVIATKAALLMLITRDFLRNTFNPAFPTLDNLRLAGGADVGTTIGTRDGMRGERELLFLGNAANKPAKIISTGLRITEQFYDALPKTLRELCEKDDDAYSFTSCTRADLADLCSDNGVAWDPEAAAARITADLEQFPLSDIACSAATELIDFDTLSIRNNKQITAASLYADITGFTAFIAKATTREGQEHALKALHLTRKEFTRVAMQDYNGIKVQFQGDRIQILAHLASDDTALARKAVNISIALQSSMDLIRDIYDGIGTLHLAIGIDQGTVIATQLGARGHRDRIVLGSSVIDAAANEERCDQRETGISTLVRDALPEDLQARFTYSKTAQCYVARGLTFSVLEEATKTSPYAGSAAVLITTNGPTIRITNEDSHGGHKVTPARSFGE